MTQPCANRSDRPSTWPFGHLFRRHVSRRADSHFARRQFDVVDRRPCQSEIGDLAAVDVILEHYVAGLDIAMDHPLGVRGRQTGGDLRGDPQCVRIGSRRPWVRISSASVGPRTSSMTM